VQVVICSGAYGEISSAFFGESDYKYCTIFTQGKNCDASRQLLLSNGIANKISPQQQLDKKIMGSGFFYAVLAEIL
jgi:hypothetical protein